MRGNPSRPRAWEESPTTPRQVGGGTSWENNIISPSSIAMLRLDQKIPPLKGSRRGRMVPPFLPRFRRGHSLRGNGRSRSGLPEVRPEGSGVS